MNRNKPLTLLLCLSFFAVSGAGTITGRVINSSSTGLAGAKVWLKNSPTTIDSTGSDGKFSLPAGAAAIRSLHIPNRGLSTFTMQHNRLDFQLSSPREITIELFNANGRKCATVFRGLGGQGHFSIPLYDDKSPLGTGSYLLRCLSDELSFIARLAIVGGKIYSNPAAIVSTEEGFGTSAIAAAADSLIVLRMGYAIKKMSLGSLSTQDVGDVTLTPRTYKLQTAVTVKPGRGIEVIVPSDYNDLYSLPVLYLLHGGGEDSATWRVKDHLIDTLNKFSDRFNVQPMIIVTPTAKSSANYGNYGKGADSFYTDLTVTIKNYVESHFKADTARFSRAISGLSMGAMQTWNLTLFYPTLWGYSFPMSGGLYKSSGFSPAKLKADIRSKVIDTATINQLKIVKAFSNPSDAAYGDTDTTCRLMDTMGIRHAYDGTTKTTGGHTPVFWNEVFRKYAPTIFK